LRRHDAPFGTVFSRFCSIEHMMHDAPAMTISDATPVVGDANGHMSAGTVRLLPHARLPVDDIAAWNALSDAAGQSGEANVFAQSWVVQAGLRHCAAQDVMVTLVNNGSGQLIGVLPLVRAQRLGRFPLHHWQVWTHPNSFCAPILIRTGQQNLFWDLVQNGLADASPSRGACALVITNCPLDGDSFSALRLLASKRAHAPTIVAKHARALAADSEPFGSYWDTHVRAKKRKELRRQAARLAELGTISVDELADDANPTPWIDEFLALERAGWKGAAGSALALAAGTQAYFREIVRDAHARGRLSFLAYRLDGRAIAMLVTLFDGDAAFSFKTAYDEMLARYSPGVQIQRDALTMLARRDVRWADSCAAADHPMIDSIWAQRRAIGTVVVGLPGVRNRLAFAAYRAALTGWRTAKRLRPYRGVPL
jgi:CelD/BcsL family acetyltransferase involved in cellulose biosynthesis